MAEAGEVGLVLSERHEGGEALLADQHDAVPALALRADQPGTALTQEDHVATAFPEMRQRMGDIAIIGFGAADRLARRQLGRGRIVRDGAEAQQVEHDDLAGDAAPEQRAAGVSSRLQMCSHDLASGLDEPASPKASRSAWLRKSLGHFAICSTKRSRSPANSARDASSKPGRSPDMADMKR